MKTTKFNQPHVSSTPRKTHGRRAAASLLAIAAVAVLAGPVAVRAVTDTYTGSSGGDWGVAGNWSLNTIPVNGQDVVIGINGAVTFDYNTDTYSSPGIFSLTLDASGGTASLYQAGSTSMYASDGAVVGYSGGGGGYYLQTGGSAVFAGLVIAEMYGSTGVYTASGGTLNVNGEVTVGYLGNGTLNISGTAQTSVGFLYVGDDIGANSTAQNSQGTANPVYNVNISGGSLTATESAGELIGNQDFGSVNQTGGTNTVGTGGSGTLTVGNGATGLYLLGGTSAVTLSAGQENIGTYSTGKFTQSGGTNTVSGSLDLGQHLYGVGVYNISGGSLSVSNGVIVGDSGNGTLNISGTAQASAGYLTVGSNSGSNSTAQNSLGGASPIYNVNISGGTLNTIGSQYIGYAGFGSVNQTGGANNAGNYSGYVSLGYDTGGVGIYTISGGTLAVGGGGYLYVGFGGAGTLNISGTAQASASYLTVGQNSGSNSTAQSSQGGPNPVYNVNISGGTLTSDHQTIGESGFGSVSQTGGTNTANTSLELGDATGGTGIYKISGGTLNASQAIVGNIGNGTLNISGSAQANMNALYIGTGVGGSGTVNSSGGALNLTSGGASDGYGQIVVGEAGSGTFNVSGSAQVGTDSLIIGDATSGNGTVNASGGSMAATAGGAYSGAHGAIVVGGKGNGTLNISGSAQASGSYMIVGQYGGSNSTAQSSQGGASPVYNVNISGGSLTTTGYQTVGDSGFGSVNQTGGSNTVGAVFALGQQSGSTGLYLLSGTGALTVNANEYIGSVGTGTFTQSGGTNTVPEALVIGNNYSDQYNLSGGILQVGISAGGKLTRSGTIANYGNFTQSGGTIQDANGGGEVAFINTGTFNYSGGRFNARLINQGTFYLTYPTASFTAGNGMENDVAFTISAGQTFTFNGQGLDNESTLTLAGGTLNGNGMLTNNNLMAGYGTIGGTGGFTNNGTLNTSYTTGSPPYGSTNSGNLVISNTGTNTNNGVINLTAGYALTLQAGSSLTNNGTLNTDGAAVNGGGPLNNNSGGLITGGGLISAQLNNNVGGEILVQAGQTTNVSQGFTNNGVIQLDADSAHLVSSHIANAANGVIEGFGSVGAPVVQDGGTIQPTGGTLIISSVQSNGGGRISVQAGSELLLSGGFAATVGPNDEQGPFVQQVINLTGGTLDTSGTAFTNIGQISGYGTLSTGGLTNGDLISGTSGSITLTGGNTTINGDVTNETGSNIEVRYNPTIFTGNVINNGTFTTTQTTVTFAGGFTNNGTVITDPTVTHYTNWVVGPSGSTIAASGDRFTVSGTFTNNSTQNTTWNTSGATLEFTGSGSHGMSLAGLDMGANAGGWSNNFAWNLLTLDSGNSLSLSSGRGSGTAAFYVSDLTGLTFNGSTITNITGNGLNVYYNPLVDSALNDQTYALTDGGSLMPAPTPEPTTLALLAVGGLALMLRRGKPALPGGKVCRLNQ